MRTFTASKLPLVILALVLCMAFILTSATVGLAYNGFSDTVGHWASEEIEKWADNELIVGNDGKFSPQSSITRAELATLIDRLFKYNLEDVPSLSDVDQDAWYYDSVSQIAAAKIIEATEGAFNPNDKMQRQEVITALAKAFLVAPAEAEKDARPPYRDLEEAGDEYLPYIMGMCNGGFIEGNGRGNLNPAGFITKAEVVTLIDNMIDAYYFKSGEYVNEKVLVIKGNVLVNSPDITFGNMVIEGNLFLAPGVGGLVMNDVYVLGNTYIMGDINLETHIGKLEDMGKPADVASKIFRQNFPELDEDKIIAEVTDLGAKALEEIYKD